MYRWNDRRILVGNVSREDKRGRVIRESHSLIVRGKKERRENKIKGERVKGKQELNS